MHRTTSAKLRGYDIGTLVADRYRIAGIVGHGGQGDVFRAEDLKSGMHKALKIGAVFDQNYTARALRNAECMSQIVHPRVARVTDYGVLPDATTYIVSDWVDGVALNEYARRATLSVLDVLLVAASAADALHAIHRAGSLHHDVKPANMIVELQHDQVGLRDLTLVDLGLSRRLRFDTRTGAQRSSYGSVTGTVGYMAPEQIAGRRTTVQTDLYALGVTLFELLFSQQPEAELEWGKPQFDDSDFPLAYVGPFVVQRLCGDIQIPSSPAIPKAVHDLLACLLQRRPEYRPSTAESVINAVRAIRDDMVVEGCPSKNCDRS